MSELIFIKYVLFFQNHDVFNTKDWQDGLRALLPNINISFGAANHSNQSLPLGHPRAPPQHPHNSLPHKCK